MDWSCVERFGVVPISLFLVFAGLNWFILIRNLVKRDRHVSMMPPVGGLSGVLGCLTIPALRYYAFAPLLLDPGT